MTPDIGFVVTVAILIIIAIGSCIWLDYLVDDDE